MIDYAAFIVASEEFDTAPPALVQAMLDEAALELTQATTDWGAMLNTAHRLLTAHKLWSSPFGATMRLDNGGEKEPTSRYWQQFTELQERALFPILVL